MPGSISLPQVVLDLEEEDRQKYAALAAPKAIVVRYGYMKLVGEFPYDGDAKPGCGSKLVVRTQRGVELGEMLTTTCSNGGCGKSVSRKDMLQYIENSGGKDYPFSTQGRVVRVATIEDLKQQEVLDAGKMDMIRFAKRAIADANLPMKLVEVEPLLGGERIIFHFASEEWVDFRELVGVLAQEFRTRIELHQVNARDEARLVADYEKCGQHCCCKQFLKVLKPVSMKSAKVQKATLDPTKISGRCGRLMCCLRYEDETYDSLKKNLPHRQTRVITEEGPGTVLDTQILTQLVLIALDSEYNAPKAFPVEHIRPMTKEEIALHKVTQPLPPQQQQQQRPPAPGNSSAPGSAPGNNNPGNRPGNSPQNSSVNNPDNAPGDNRRSGPSSEMRSRGNQASDSSGPGNASTNDAAPQDPQADEQSQGHREQQQSAQPPQRSDRPQSRPRHQPGRPQQQQQQPARSGDPANFQRPKPGRPVDAANGQPIDTRDAANANNGPIASNSSLSGDASQEFDDDTDGPDEIDPGTGTGAGNETLGEQSPGEPGNPEDRPKRRRRRRRRRRGGPGSGPGNGDAGSAPGNAPGSGPAPTDGP